MKILVNGYTVSEHLELKAIDNDLMKLDKQIAHIKRNKKLYMQLVVILALIVPSATLKAYVMATGCKVASTMFMTSDIGMKAYSMGVYVAKAICLLGWLTESIKCVLTGTLDGLGKVSIKWISFALIVKFLPDVVNWIFNV